MSLKEFNDSLGGPSWADDDIDLSSISVPIQNHAEESHHHFDSDPFRHNDNVYNYRKHNLNSLNRGSIPRAEPRFHIDTRGPPPELPYNVPPPFIAKFSNLTTEFHNDHLIKLFNNYLDIIGSFPKFIERHQFHFRIPYQQGRGIRVKKFKLFWELSKDGNLSVENHKKVAFVEFNNLLDLNLALMWNQQGIYNHDIIEYNDYLQGRKLRYEQYNDDQRLAFIKDKIQITLADFDDFMRYQNSTDFQTNLSHLHQQHLQAQNNRRSSFGSRSSGGTGGLHRIASNASSYNHFERSRSNSIISSGTSPFTQHQQPHIQQPTQEPQVFPASKPKLNPFGLAKPVDTLTKELELEKIINKHSLNSTTFQLGIEEEELKAQSAKEKSDIKNNAGSDETAKTSANSASTGLTAGEQGKHLKAKKSPRLILQKTAIASRSPSNKGEANGASGPSFSTVSPGISYSSVVRNQMNPLHSSTSSTSASPKPAPKTLKLANVTSSAFAAAVAAAAGFSMKSSSAAVPTDATAATPIPSDSVQDHSKKRTEDQPITATQPLRDVSKLSSQVTTDGADDVQNQAPANVQNETVHQASTYLPTASESNTVNQNSTFNPSVPVTDKPLPEASNQQQASVAPQPVEYNNINNSHEPRNGFVSLLQNDPKPAFKPTSILKNDLSRELSQPTGAKLVQKSLLNAAVTAPKAMSTAAPSPAVPSPATVTLSAAMEEPKPEEKASGDIEALEAPAAGSEKPKVEETKPNQYKPSPIPKTNPWTKQKVSQLKSDDEKIAEVSQTKPGDDGTVLIKQGPSKQPKVEKEGEEKKDAAKISDKENVKDKASARKRQKEVKKEKSAEKLAKSSNENEASQEVKPLKSSSSVSIISATELCVDEKPVKSRSRKRELKNGKNGALKSDKKESEEAASDEQSSVASAASKKGRKRGKRLQNKHIGSAELVEEKSVEAKAVEEKAVDEKKMRDGSTIRAGKATNGKSKEKSDTLIKTASEPSPEIKQTLPEKSEKVEKSKKSANITVSTKEELDASKRLAGKRERLASTRKPQGKHNAHYYNENYKNGKNILVSDSNSKESTTEKKPSANVSDTVPERGSEKAEGQTDKQAAKRAIFIDPVSNTLKEKSGRAPRLAKGEKKALAEEVAQNETGSAKPSANDWEHGSTQSSRRNLLSYFSGKRGGRGGRGGRGSFRGRGRGGAGAYMAKTTVFNHS